MGANGSKANSIEPGAAKTGIGAGSANNGENQPEPMDMSIPEGMNLIDQRYEEKMAAFELDCNDGMGVGKACHQVGEYYSVVKEEYARSKVIYETNCFREKDPYFPSCFNLARLYLGGRGGVEQSDKKAAELFEKACDCGHLQGCYHQGVLQFLLNEGNQRKQLRAIDVMARACSEGEADSCYFAGSHYLDKKLASSIRNPEKAIDLLQMGCDRNHAPSCYNLAILFKNGDDGVPADKQRYEEFKVKTETLVGGGSSINGTKIG